MEQLRPNSEMLAGIVWLKQQASTVVVRTRFGEQRVFIIL